MLHDASLALDCRNERKTKVRFSGRGFSRQGHRANCHERFPTDTDTAPAVDSGLRVIRTFEGNPHAATMAIDRNAANDCASHY